VGGDVTPTCRRSADENSEQAWFTGSDWPADEVVGDPAGVTAAVGCPGVVVPHAVAPINTTATTTSRLTWPPPLFL
jgi:hypothetical protein